MTPDFNDEGIVIIKQTSDIAVGQIGLFDHDGEEVIKECGEDRLILHNPEYPDIQDKAMTIGVVLGKAVLI